MVNKIFGAAIDGVATVANNLRDKVTDEKFLRQVESSASTAVKTFGKAVDGAATVANNLRDKVNGKISVTTREISEADVPPDVREKINRRERVPVLEKIDTSSTFSVGEKIVRDAVKNFNKSFRRF